MMQRKTYLNFGGGLAWAGHTKLNPTPAMAVVLRDVSLVPRLGTEEPTGARLSIVKLIIKVSKKV